jgi:hypothetical protein
MVQKKTKKEILPDLNKRGVFKIKRHPSIRIHAGYTGFTTGTHPGVITHTPIAGNVTSAVQIAHAVGSVDTENLTTIETCKAGIARTCVNGVVAYTTI